MINLDSTDYKDVYIGPSKFKLPKSWDKIKLEDCCEILDTQRVPLNSEEREKMKGKIPYYGANGVVDHINDYIFNEKLLLIAEDGGHFEEFRERPISYIIEGESWVNNHAHVLRVKNGVITEWAYYTTVHKNLIPYVHGSTRKKLNQKELRRIEIPLPPEKEQKKIIKILSTVDELIQKTQKIIKKTQVLKKGLMQDLLIKGIGHYQFKEINIGPKKYEIPEEWESKEITEVCEINPESFNPKSYEDDYFQYIDIQSVKKNKIIGAKRIKTHKAPSRARRKVFQDEIIVSTVRPYLQAFAMIPNKYNECVCSTGFAVLNCKEENFPDFILQTILSKYFLNQMITRMVGTNYPAVNLSDFENINLIIPPFQEQKKISQIFSDIDEKIRLEQIYDNNLEILKKGLMQDLLTGKVRVNNIDLSEN